MHLALTEHMHMDVMYRLTSKVVAVHDNPKAFLTALLFGQTLRGKKDMASEKLVVILTEVMQGCDVFLWNYQEMRRRLGRDVIEGDNLFVFIDLLRGEGPGDDLAK
jgi:hypothetical protein|tara:strand:- start:2719 stop:3036 length:318 start_codon:yes stop_codon:yes gene_type:complete